MSVILEDTQAISLMERLRSAEKEMCDASRLIAEAGRVVDELAERATAAENRADAAERRANDLADQIQTLKLKLAQYETGTQPPAEA
jgi:Mg2+ and Co2+ transporter CorA